MAAQGDGSASTVAGPQGDMIRLVGAKLVDKSWSKNRYRGIVSRSVVVFVLRNGNPKHIKTWDDLVKPGVQVVFPNPFSSGGAKWDIMAAYGSAQFGERVRCCR